MNLSKLNKNQLIEEYKTLKGKYDEAKAWLNEKLSAIDDLKNKVDELDESNINKDERIASLVEALEKSAKELQDARVELTSRTKELSGVNNKVKLWKYIAIGLGVAFLISLCVIIA